MGHPIRWQSARTDEYLSRRQNGAWKPAGLSPDEKALSLKWVFRNRTNANELNRHMAELAA